jgi:acetoin utilization deacetylase AcuC-like enzyme
MDSESQAREVPTLTHPSLPGDRRPELMQAGVVVVGSVDHSDLHDTGVGHPERAERTHAVYAGVERAGVGDSLIYSAGRPATRAELLRVHRSEYLNSLCDFIVGGGRQLDPDTTVSAGSWDAALYSAGGGLAAIEALDRREARSAFVAMRPPGHHATASSAMGFCLLNNVAIAAASLIERGERVLIVDWDVHHGNGTQAIFWDDPRVLYVSIHEWPSYPGTGWHTETGGPTATGLTVNIPLPAGATGDVAHQAFDQIISPAAEEFGPTWVLVSCGFDAHRDDPLAGLAWSAGDYFDLTRAVARLAPGVGHLVLLLEGGYDLNAVTLSAGAVVSSMAGGNYRPEPSTSGGPGRETVNSLTRTRARTRELDR